MKFYSLDWILIQGFLILASLLGFHMPNFNSDSFFLRYCPLGEQKIEFAESETGVWINFGTPELFSFFAGTKENLAEWRIRKEAPEKICLEEHFPQSKTIEINGKQIQPQKTRVFSPTGELIAANCSPDYKIIPYPDFPLKIGETWYASFIKRNCHGRSFFYCYERSKDFKFPYYKIFSGGYDYRPISSLLLAKIFFSLRLINGRDGFFQGVQNYGIYLFYFLDGFKSRLQIEISNTTAKRNEDF